MTFSGALSVGGHREGFPDFLSLLDRFTSDLPLVASKFVLRVFSLSALLLLPLFAQDMRHQPEGSQIAGPGQPSGALGWLADLEQWKRDRDADFPSWLADLKQWRRERLIRMGYSDAEYRRPELRWAQRNFIQPQMMVEERYFYDPVAGKYTVDRYLDDLKKLGLSDGAESGIKRIVLSGGPPAKRTLDPS